MNVTLNDVVAGVTILSLVGSAVVGIVGWFLHERDVTQQKEMDRLEAMLKAAWADIDLLKAEKSTYLTRQDHMVWREESRRDNESLRSEVKSDIAALGTRLIREIDVVSKRFTEDITRIMNAMKESK